MRTSQRLTIGVAISCATLCSAIVMKGERLRSHSDRMTPFMEQEPAFNRDCKAFPNKRIIVVTVNSEYWDMFLNWVHHAKVYMSDHDQLVVFAQDAGIATMLQKGSFVFVDLNGTLNYPADEDELSARRVAAPYNSAEFNSLVHKRPDNILYFLKLNCTVLYSDVDTVWIGDVFQDVAEAGPHDLYITDDSRSNRLTNVWNFCSCFLYLQPTPPVLELMQSWTRAMVGRNGNDQAPFNRVLESDSETRQSVDFTVLPFGAFPPGCKADRFWGTPAMHVLHANYMSGIGTKKDFIVNHGVWTQ